MLELILELILELMLELMLELKPELNLDGQGPQKKIILTIRIVFVILSKGVLNMTNLV